MATFDARKLTAEVTQRTRDQIDRALQDFGDLDQQQLFWRPEPDRWGIADCFEHMDRFAEMYMQRIEREVDAFKENRGKASAKHTSGYVGNMMTERLEPTQEGAIRYKVRTFRLFNPIKAGESSPMAVKNFVRQQERLLKSLEEADQLDLTRIRITSAIGGILRFRLGDVYRILAAHSERHMLQAWYVLKDDRFPIKAGAEA